jgi:hypothetical protein
MAGRRPVALHEFLRLRNLGLIALGDRAVRNLRVSSGAKPFIRDGASDFMSTMLCYGTKMATSASAIPFGQETTINSAWKWAVIMRELLMTVLAGIRKSPSSRWGYRFKVLSLCGSVSLQGHVEKTTV